MSSRTWLIVSSVIMLSESPIALLAIYDNYSSTVPRSQVKHYAISSSSVLFILGNHRIFTIGLDCDHEECLRSSMLAFLLIF